jgi:hypothetical protein
MFKSEQIQKIYAQKEGGKFNTNTFKMFELFHYLNMFYNKNINFNNIDESRLNKLLTNIMSKFEIKNVLDFLENVDISMIMAVIEHSFYHQNIKEIQLKNPIKDGKEHFSY